MRKSFDAAKLTGQSIAMKQVENTVFISYRRTNIFNARAIFQHLTEEGYDVFLDYERLDSGNFPEQIFESIESRAHFLLLLTPSALERCQKPDDWVRREIEHALKFKRNIIPLMFDDFDLNEMSEYLPDRIAKPLSKCNGLKVPAIYFEAAMERLREKFLSVPLNLVLHTKSESTIKMEEKHKQIAIAEKPVTEKELSAEEYFEGGKRDLHNLRYNNRHDDNRHCETAINKFNRAIELKQDYAEAYNGRGVAYRYKRDYYNAIKDYEEAISRNPNYAIAYYNRGRAYEAMGDDYEARGDDYEARGDDYEARGDAYEARGDAYEARGAYEKALVDFEKALKIKPDFEPARSHLNIVRRKLNR